MKWHTQFEQSIDTSKGILLLLALRAPWYGVSEHAGRDGAL